MLHSIPHLPVTPTQLVRPGIGQNMSCAVGDFVPVVHTQTYQTFLTLAATFVDYYSNGKWDPKYTQKHEEYSHKSRNYERERYIS